MPRLTALRVTALERLAADLRFAPKDRVVAIVRAAETLAPTIDPDDVVDEADLVHALTAYRPDLDDPASIPGSALLADLSPLAERVSEASRLSEAVIPDALSADDLAARWNVSVKTVSRLRREGLIAWRVRTRAGKVAVRFSPEHAAAFEAARDLAKRAPSRPRRLAPDQTARLARVARRAQRRFAWSRTETARRLAQRTGRAYETIRRALQRELGPPIPRATARRRRDAHKHWLLGQRAADIAETVARSPQTARRWIDAERRAAVLDLALPPADPPMDAAALDHPLAQTNLLVRAHATAAEFVEAARSAGPADPAALRTLDGARTAALLAARAAAAREGDADDAETHLRWARLLAHRIVDLHPRLTLAAIETTVGGPLLQLSPPVIRALCREAMRAALDGVARHDARAGSSVSGAINVALTRRLARAAETAGARRALASGNRAESPAAGLDDWTKRPSPWPDPYARVTPDQTDDPALGAWIVARSGAAGARPLTVAQAGETLGHARARAARLDREARALAAQTG